MKCFRMHGAKLVGQFQNATPNLGGGAVRNMDGFVQQSVSHTLVRLERLLELSGRMA
jgi:hypothetical protein